MKAGDTTRVDCENCETEFELTYEPKAKVLNEKEKEDFPEQEPTCCPFCGSNDVVYE